MKRLLSVTLGILTAIGGFVDIGDLVANAAVGARFRWNLAWVVLVGIVGIILYAEMAGRVATLTKRATFDIVRERLGPRMALGNLVASMAVTFLTLIAEVAGVGRARVDRDLAGAVRTHGAGVRPARSGAGGVRRRRVAPGAELGRRRPPRQPPARADR